MMRAKDLRLDTRSALRCWQKSVKQDKIMTLFGFTVLLKCGLREKWQKQRWREGRGKNHRGFTMSEPSCERVSPLTGEEILLQSVSVLKRACNRHKHARPAQTTLVLHFHHVASLFKHAGRNGAHWQRWKRGKKVKRKKDMSPGLWGCPWLWKICTFLSPHLRLESTVSRKHGS